MAAQRRRRPRAALRQGLRARPPTPCSGTRPTRALAAELRLEAEGAARGAQSLPGTEDDGLDVIEQRILDRVGELRRKGLDNYATNRQVYHGRLTRAAEARKAAEFVAGKAGADIHAAVKIWKARVATPRARVIDAYCGLHAYRRRNRLDRPADEAQPFLRWLFVVVLLLVIESAINAGLFAQHNALGYAGGGLAAFLISTINVASASLAVFFGRNVNHVNWFRKNFGTTIVIAGVLWVFAFNLGVAHFRDAVEFSRTGTRQPGLPGEARSKPRSTSTA